MPIYENLRDLTGGIGGVDDNGNIMSLHGLVLRPAGDGYTYIYDRDSGNPVLRLRYVDSNNYKVYLRSNGTWIELLVNQANGIPLLDANGQLDFAALMGTSKEYLFDDFFYLNTLLWTAATGGGGSPMVGCMSGKSAVGLQAQGAIGSYANIYTPHFMAANPNLTVEFQFAGSATNSLWRLGVTCSNGFDTTDIFAWVAIKYEYGVDTTMKIEEKTAANTYTNVYDTGIAPSGTPNTTTTIKFVFYGFPGGGGYDIYVNGVNKGRYGTLQTFSCGLAGKITAKDASLRSLYVMAASINSPR